MGKCEKDEVWESYLNGEFDGTFTIIDPKEQGYFTGSHDSDVISGRCWGNKISYTRYKASGAQTYSGQYQNDNYISGRHLRLSFSKLKKLTEDDEWVGTHVTLTAPRKRAASGKKKMSNRKR